MALNAKNLNAKRNNNKVGKQTALAFLPDMVRQVFSADGPLARRISNYRFSPAQQGYALRVAKTLLTGNQLNSQKSAITLLEAATGIGKSLGYLIPLALYAALSSKRVAVSTYTLQLQRQLTGVHGDLHLALAIVEQLTNRPLTFAVRKGLRNFVSVRRVNDLLAGFTDTAAPDELRAFQRWAALASDCGVGGELQDWKESHNGLLPLGLNDADVCLQPWDDDSTRIAYRSHVERAREADLVFVTHALLLLNNYRWFSLLDSDEKPLQAVAVDEADRLESAAESIYQRLIPLNGANRLCQSLDARLSADTSALRNALGQLRHTFNTVRQFPHQATAGEHYLLLNDASGSAHKPAIARQLSAALRAIDTLVDGLELRPQLSANTLQPEVAELAKTFLNLQLDMQEFHDALHSSSTAQQTYSVPALRWSPVQALPSLCLIPLYPGRLTARLWQTRHSGKRTQPYLQSCILTSATLSAPGADMLDFEREIGIYRPDHHVCNTLNARLEPDDFGQIRLVLADPAAPSPSLSGTAQQPDSDETGTGKQHTPYTATEWLDYCADMIRGAQTCGGRVLVLTTSYHNALALGERVPQSIVHQPNTRLSDYIDNFRADPDAVWITPGAWEGLNLPGLIAHLVLTRLPFAPVDSARSTALLSCLISRGMDRQTARRTLFALSRNNAKRRFRQGFGRGIRQASDNCTVWIADPRFPPPPALLKQWLSEHDFPALRDDGYPDFLACIPRRFREGLGNSYASATVWPLQT